MKFTGTKNYVSTEDLSMAVNATIALERPLIIKGEPGTGKTLLAIEVAESLGMELIEWHVKSTTKASQGLYEYDAVTRLRDSQLGDERVKDIKNYIKKGKLWHAFESDKQIVLLIDEIDKADIEFPNDLLQELELNIALSTGEKKKLVGIFTINEEKVKALPDDKVLDFHKRGLFVPIYSMLGSLSQMNRLAQLRNQFSENKVTGVQIIPAVDKAANES